jgi:hypothetical protein
MEPIKITGILRTAQVKSKAESSYSSRPPETTLLIGVEVTVPKPRPCIARERFAGEWQVRNALTDYRKAAAAAAAPKKKGAKKTDALTCADCGEVFDDAAQLDAHADDCGGYDDDGEDNLDDAPTLAQSFSDFKTEQQFLDALYQQHREEVAAYNRTAGAGAGTIGVLMQLLNQPLAFVLEPESAQLFLLDAGEPE